MQLYTSGTTGLPKGVMLTNANLSTAVGEAGETFSIRSDTVSLVAMPLFHIGGSGWALCAMSHGGRSIILRDVDPALLARTDRHGADHRDVHRAGRADAPLGDSVLATTDLSSLRLIFYGVSPISEDVLVKCMAAFGCGFCQVYGMTETTGAITALPFDDHDPDGPRRGLLRSRRKAARLAWSCGWSTPTRERTPMSVRSARSGRASPYNMAGYWGKPDETAATIDADGWLRTGDAGYFDDEGYLYLHDRIKDMVVSGGENIYPAEVENVLLVAPAVVDAAVIGVPDDKWGETVKAIVVLAPGNELDGRGECHRTIAGAIWLTTSAPPRSRRSTLCRATHQASTEARARCALLAREGAGHRLSKEYREASHVRSGLPPSRSLRPLILGAATDGVLDLLPGLLQVTDHLVGLFPRLQALLSIWPAPRRFLDLAPSGLGHISRFVLECDD